MTYRSILAAEIASLAANHVAAGGYLGASWPEYVIPRGMVTTQHQLDAACKLIPPHVWRASERNFEDAASQPSED